MPSHGAQLPLPAEGEVLVVFSEVLEDELVQVFGCFQSRYVSGVVQ